MRYALVSDLHANEQAWKTVLLDIRSLRADVIICLGDVVGYGPNPAEVLESAHANADYLVMGNHDAALCGKLDADCFTERARESLEWTRTRVNADALEFLGSRPLSLAGDGFRCAHGEFGETCLFRYVFEPEDARDSWAAVEEPLLFVGHTHQPGIFVLGDSGVPRAAPAQDFELEPGKRFLVNVGSVGEQRDGDVRASYCIYDSSAAAVYWRRLPYDLDAFRDAIRRAGRSEAGHAVFECDPRLAHAGARQFAGFHPPEKHEQGVQGALPVQAIERIKRQAVRWRRLALGLGAAAILLAALALGIWHSYRDRSQVIAAGPAGNSAGRGALEPDAGLLPAPGEMIAAGKPIPGWEVRLGNRRAQSIECAMLEDGAPAYCLRSRSRKNELRMVSGLISVLPGESLALDAWARKSPDFKGRLAFVVSVIRDEDGREDRIDQCVVKEPVRRRKDGWLQAQETFKVPARARAVEVSVRGEFTGIAWVREVALTRRQASRDPDAERAQ
ncbi:MAG: metallophosphoesterase family protein [Lentisphaerae bacterium]|nr:metallophosphoesterase family protein [Lentisphaerota bacterium]